MYYEDTDLYTASTVDLGGSVQYRVRPIYEVPIPIDYEGWSNTVTEIDIGLDTTGGA